MGEDIKVSREDIQKLTYNSAAGAIDDPITFRRKDPTDWNSPWVVTVTGDQGVTTSQWGDAANFGPLNRELTAHLRTAAEELNKELKGHIEIQVLSGPAAADADIHLMMADTPNWNAVSIGGWENGKVRKETVISRQSKVFNPEHGRLPLNDYMHPQNPCGEMAKYIRHELAHQLGLKHWDDREFAHPQAGGDDRNSDLTVMAYPVGKNMTVTYRPLDFASIKSLYPKGIRLYPEKDGPKRLLVADNAPEAITFNSTAHVYARVDELAKTKSRSVENVGIGAIVLEMTPEQKATARKQSKIVDNLVYYDIIFTDKHGEHHIGMHNDAAYILAIDATGKPLAPPESLKTAIKDAPAPEAQKKPPEPAAKISQKISSDLTSIASLFLWSPAVIADHTQPMAALPHKKLMGKGKQ